MNEEKTHKFLMGLNDETFSTTRSQVLALGPLPSIDVIWNMFPQEENREKVMLAQDHRSKNIVAFAAKGQVKNHHAKSRRLGGRGRLCSHEVTKHHVRFVLFIPRRQDSYKLYSYVMARTNITQRLIQTSSFQQV